MFGELCAAAVENCSPSGHRFQPYVLFNAELLIYAVNITFQSPAKTRERKRHYQAIVLRAANNSNIDFVDTEACGRGGCESLTNGLVVKYSKVQMMHVCA